MLVEDERRPAGLAEAAIGEADAVGLDELRWRGLVIVLDHRSSLWLWRSSRDAKRWKAGGSRTAAKTAKSRFEMIALKSGAKACSRQDRVSGSYRHRH
jgi:hypothetical protein